MCSRHRCPHFPKRVPQGDGPCLLSEYNNRYVPHQMERREPFKPKHEAIQSNQPIDDKTTHRSDILAVNVTTTCVYLNSFINTQLIIH